MGLGHDIACFRRTGSASYDNAGAGPALSVISFTSEQAALDCRSHAESIMALARSPPSNKCPSPSVTNHKTGVSWSCAFNSDETGSALADNDTVPTGCFHYLLPRNPRRLTSPPPSDPASPPPCNFWTIKDIILNGKQWRAMCPSTDEY